MLLNLNELKEKKVLLRLFCCAVPQFSLERITMSISFPRFHGWTPESFPAPSQINVRRLHFTDVNRCLQTYAVIIWVEIKVFLYFFFQSRRRKKSAIGCRAFWNISNSQTTKLLGPYTQASSLNSRDKGKNNKKKKKKFLLRISFCVCGWKFVFLFFLFT